MNYIDGLNEINCNARINALSKFQESIGKRIDSSIVTGDLKAADDFQKLYEDTCNIMDVLCEFRRTHDCALI